MYELLYNKHLWTNEFQFITVDNVSFEKKQTNDYLMDSQHF